MSEHRGQSKATDREEFLAQMRQAAEKSDPVLRAQLEAKAILDHMPLEARGMVQSIRVIDGGAEVEE